MSVAMIDRKAESLEAWLVARIAEALEARPADIDVEEAFSNLGLSSRDAILLSGDIEDHLGVGELEPSLMWDFPTIRKLAEHLAAL